MFKTPERYIIIAFLSDLYMGKFVYKKLINFPKMFFQTAPQKTNC